MYDPVSIQPFRDELTRIGIRELRSAAEVDDVMNQKKGNAPCRRQFRLRVCGGKGAAGDYESTSTSQQSPTC